MMEKGFGLTRGLFTPTFDTETRNHDLQNDEQLNDTLLSDYERHIVAMQEYPEIMPLVQDIIGSVEIGEISEEYASSMFAELAVRVVCDDMKRT